MVQVVPVRMWFGGFRRYRFQDADRLAAKFNYQRILENFNVRRIDGAHHHQRRVNLGECALASLFD
ncbi:hypothetical protein [Microcoleus vaginatus]|uniref:hypothetical protein n=1 Tax=Microcoleus vaginatus TaxID=119532 RepID=UPI004040857B